MHGPFSIIVTVKPARASRSAGAAAPNPVPMITTSVCTVRMTASLGVIAGVGQRCGQEAWRVVVTHRGAAIAAGEINQRAAGVIVVDTGVERDLRQKDRSPVELACGPIRREAIADDLRALSERELPKPAMTEPLTGAVAQVRGEKRGVARKRISAIEVGTDQIGGVCGRAGDHGEDERAQDPLDHLPGVLELVWIGTGDDTEG